MVLHWYMTALQRYTLPTQMATGGFFSGLGEVIYQQGFERRGWNNHEWFRTQRLMVWGGLCFAPLANRWHWLLSKINFDSKVKTLVARQVTDMSIFAPLTTAYFYTYTGLVEGRPFTSKGQTQGIKERLLERWWGTVWKQWLVFGPATAINLSLVPIYARPPFMNVFSCGWSVFLAMAQNKGRLDANDTLPKPQQHSMVHEQLGNEPTSIVAAKIVQ